MQATKKPHNYHKTVVWQKDDRIRKSPLKFYVYYYSELSGDCQVSIFTELWRLSVAFCVTLWHMSIVTWNIFAKSSCVISLCFLISIIFAPMFILLPPSGFIIELMVQKSQQLTFTHLKYSRKESLTSRKMQNRTASRPCRPALIELLPYGYTAFSFHLI